MNRDGQLRKLTLNADGMLSGTVYGDIHPSGRFGVFSTNIVLPGMHTVATKRMEVYDTASDLTVADFDRNVMVNVPHVARADAFETFPCFSADGKSVFYCVADSHGVAEHLGILCHAGDGLCDLKFLVPHGSQAGSVLLFCPAGGIVIANLA